MYIENANYSNVLSSGVLLFAYNVFLQGVILVVMWTLTLNKICP